MPLKVIEYGTPEYQQMVALRANILRRPLGLTFQPTELDEERNNILIGAFEDDELMGCCMLLEEEPGIIRLRQMAVLESLQGKGVGKAIMNFAENVARDRGYKKITMHARKNAIGFYEKMGYEVRGDEFSEVTIPHYLMEKSLKQ
jgi:GNAT superfamily N-acetyltransferase